MAKAKTKLDRCTDNDGTVYKIGDEWSDHGVCNLKICEGGGHISIKLCPSVDSSSGCTRAEGDLNQSFPQCCPKLGGDSSDSSSESSSSSSSDEDEDDLFDDEGDGGDDMDVFRMEETSNQTEVSDKDEKIDSSVNEVPKEEKIIQNKVTKESNENSNNAHRITSSENDNKVNDTMSKTDVSNGDDSTPDLLVNKETLDYVVANSDIVTNVKSTISETNGNASIETTTDKTELNNNPIVKNDFSDSSIDGKPINTNQTFEEKEVKLHILDGDENTFSSQETEPVIENVQLVQENTNRDIKNQEGNASITRKISEESMDSINYTALGHDVKEDKDVHILNAMDEEEESGQYKFTDYVDDIANDAEFKKLINLEMDNDRTTKEKIWQVDGKSAGNTEIIESDFINKRDFKNTEGEQQEMTDLNFTQASSKTEITDGIIYNHEDSEGFIKQSEENVMMKSMHNETIVEKTDILDQDASYNNLNFSQEPISNENIDYSVNQHVEEPNVADTGGILNKNEEPEIIPNISDVEEKFHYHDQQNETGLVNEYLEYPQSITQITDTAVLTDDITEIRNLDANNLITNDLTAINTHPLMEESNISARDIVPSTDDPEPFKSFEDNLDNHIEANFEDNAGLYDNTVEQAMLDNLVQENGDSPESIETYQIPEENNIQTQGFEEFSSSEVIEDQTHLAEYSSQSEVTTDSNSEVVESIDNSPEDTDEIQ